MPWGDLSRRPPGLGLARLSEQPVAPRYSPWLTGSLMDAVSPGLPLCTGFFFFFFCTGFLEQHLISNQAFISWAFKGPSLGGCGA